MKVPIPVHKTHGRVEAAEVHHCGHQALKKKANAHLKGVIQSVHMGFIGAKEDIQLYNVNIAFKCRIQDCLIEGMKTRRYTTSVPVSVL